MNKECRKCNVIKPVSEFYKRKIVWSKDDGYDYYCKECRNKCAKDNYHNNSRKCTTGNCKKPHYALGLCKVHYNKRRLENIKKFHDIFVDPDNKRKEW